MIEIKAPASKSYAQRAIICATLAVGQSVVRSVGHSDDVESAIKVCRALGATIERHGDDLLISSNGKLRSARLDVGESGLLTRLIAPIAAVCCPKTEIMGRGTLLNRPMHALIDALEKLGVRVESANGYLPLKIEGEAHPTQYIEIDGSEGSQVISGLLMALPFMRKLTTIKVNNLRSAPYVSMTIDILSQFDVFIQNEPHQGYQLARNDNYTATSYTVEGDWSGASYWVVADAIAGGGKIKVMGLLNNSLQADCAILDAIDKAKNKQCFEFDATHCPDLFPALVALASHCEGQSRIIGTKRLAHKESARDIVLRDEWAKFGVHIDLSTDNEMIIHGVKDRKVKQTAPIYPHGDHRIAMAAAIMGQGIEVENRDVVNKSYPEFWEDLKKIEHLLK